MPEGQTDLAGQTNIEGRVRVLPRTGIYLWGFSLLSLTVVWHEWSSGTLMGDWRAVSLVLLAAVAGVGTLKIRRFGRLSLSFPFVIVALLVCGLPVAILAGLGAGLSAALISRRRSPHWEWVLLGTIRGTLAAFAAGRIFLLAGGQSGLPLRPADLNGVLAATGGFLLVNCLFSVLIRNQFHPENFLSSWGRYSLESAPAFAAGAVLASLLAILFDRFGLGILLPSVVLVFTLFYFRKFYFEFVVRGGNREREKAENYLSIIEALVTAIDAKDRTPDRHLRRVQHLSVELAKMMSLPRKEMEALMAATLLHDIGKLAVPEYILSKPGKLTHEEFERMTIHPRVGAEILESVHLPGPLIKIVRSHHEKIDGTGYPDKLRGKEIPLAARILSVVDCYDALTSDRPFRKAVSKTQALHYIRERAGKDFDPQVVDLLLREIHRLEAECETLHGTGSRPLFVPPGQDPEEPPLDFSRDRGELRQSVIDNISASHREIYSLYEIVQTLSKSLNLEETLNFVTGQIHKLVPFDCCALYLLDRSHQDLYARFVTGIHSDQLKANRIPLGERLSGWAAFHRKPLLWERPAVPHPGEPGRFDLVNLPADSPLRELSSSLVAPLCADDGELIGVLALYHSKPSVYNDDHVRLLRIISNHVACTVRNALLHEETQEHALTDPLTTLPNARYLFVSFEEELTRASNLRIPLTIVEMDVDNFKDINDIFGHLVGDKILRGIAKAIRSQLRGCDSCARYAGDEFIVILPGVGREDVDYVERRLASCVESFSYSPRPGKNIQVKISLGSATFPEEGHSFESLIGVADARMYAQKYRKRREDQNLPAAPVLPRAGNLGKR